VRYRANCSHYFSAAWACSEINRETSCSPGTKHQAEKVFTNVEGTLAGFRSPTYAQGFGVAGFHLHFLRRDKQIGGHALDYRLRMGKVQICTVHDLRVELPTSVEFLKTNFEDPALNQKIKAAEG
jgi:acetolactate decarboxylase